MTSFSKFKEWFLEKRDIDTLLITLLLTIAIQKFLESFEKSILNPIFKTFMNIGSKNEDYQTVNIGTSAIKFQLQYLLSGIIAFLIYILVAYIITRVLK